MSQCRDCSDLEANSPMKQKEPGRDVLEEGKLRKKWRNLHDKVFLRGASYPGRLDQSNCFQ